jgi:uncharacterized protein (DUF433 family)
MNYNNYIEINSDIRFGKPVLKGTRITVSDILGMLANGISEIEIIGDYPNISINHIRACLKIPIFN